MINLQEKYDPLYVPLDIIPEGYEYAWIRENKRRHCGGWSLVPCDRKGHERFVGAYSYNRCYSNELGYIQIVMEEEVSLFLCERPKSFGDLERKTHEEAEIEKINAMPGIEIAENIGKEIFGEDFCIDVVNETTGFIHQIKE